MDYDDLFYYTRGRNESDKYNFSLAPLIEDFSFIDFCNNGFTDDHGGFLVITNRQYILGINPGFGELPHCYSFARVMKDLKGSGNISGQQEASRLTRELEDKYITARIVYETYRDEETHKVKKAGYIHFHLCNYYGNKLFSKEQYHQFLNFYEKYNDEIKKACKKYNFTVNYTYKNEIGQVINNCSTDLDNVLEYIEKHLVDTSSLDDEVIIGCASYEKKR